MLNQLHALLELDIAGSGTVLPSASLTADLTPRRMAGDLAHDVTGNIARPLVTGDIEEDIEGTLARPEIGTTDDR